VNGTRSYRFGEEPSRLTSEGVLVSGSEDEEYAGHFREEVLLVGMRTGLLMLVR